MSRHKIAAYITPDFSEPLKKLAAVQDRSSSDLIEDAIIRYFGLHRPRADRLVALSLSTLDNSPA
ncbi:MAG: hypothetical protein QM773_06955 [Hyphomonadaceae bacterium]